MRNFGSVVFSSLHRSVGLTVSTLLVSSAVDKRTVFPVFLCFQFRFHLSTDVGISNKLSTDKIAPQITPQMHYKLPPKDR